MFKLGARAQKFVHNRTYINTLAGNQAKQMING